MRTKTITTKTMKEKKMTTKTLITKTTTKTRQQDKKGKSIGFKDFKYIHNLHNQTHPFQRRKVQGT